MPTSWNVSSLIRSARLVLGIRWLIGAIDASLPGALTLDFVGRLGADRREVAAAMMTASMAMRFMVKHGVVPFSGWVGVGGYDPERVERVGSMHSRIYGEPERASAMLDAPWWGGLRIRIAVCETDSWRVSLSGERRLDVDGVDTVLLEGRGGPPVVLLHGTALSPAFPRERRAAPSLPRQGKRLYPAATRYRNGRDPSVSADRALTPALRE